MKKIIIPMLAAILLLACGVSTAPLAPAKTPVPATAAASQPTPTAVKTEIPFEFTEAPQEENSNDSPLTVVELFRNGGSLLDQLTAHAQTATGLGQDPILYFTASW